MLNSTQSNAFYHMMLEMFTSVPVGPALQIIKNRLEQDTQLQHRTKMSVQHITQLLEFCVHNTNSLLQGQYYKQREGEAMGSPLSPKLANMYQRS